jgi:hypothetical protein
MSDITRKEFDDSSMDSLSPDSRADGKNGPNDRYD